MTETPESPPLSLRQINDDLWSYLFGMLFLGNILLGVVGLQASSWIPFIPSDAAEAAGRYWIPGIVTLAFIGMLALHKAGAGPRRLAELWRYYGAAVTSGLVLVCAALVFSLCFVAGDAGVEKSFALIAKYLPSATYRLDAAVSDTRDFSRGNPGIRWVHVNWPSPNGLQTEFAYPASRLAAMHCADARIVVAGDLSWAGLLIRQVECIPGR